MRTSLVIGAACLAASLAMPAIGQQPAPRAHVATRMALQSTPYLGIGVQDIDAERAKALKLKEEHGAEVTSVTADSPASKAGIKEGDVVLEFNGQRVEGGEQLSRMVRETPAGRQVKLTLWRNGSNQTLTATVEARKGSFMAANGDWPVAITVPEMPPVPQIDIPNFYVGMRSARLGIEGESLGREGQLAEFFGVKEGVLVKVVVKNSAAEKAGIKAGDVITKVDDAKVTSTREITAALRAGRPRTNYTVTVVRNKKELPVTVTIEDTTGRDRMRAAAVPIDC